MSVDPVSVGIKVALMAAQMALTASQRIKGPRLDSLDVTTADYGTPIPRFWGRRRLSPPIIWAEKLHEVKHTSKTKGGKYDQWKYYGTFAVLICDHPIDAVLRIWMDKHLVLQYSDAGPVSPVAALIDFGIEHSSDLKLVQGHNMRIYKGSEDQLPDPRMTAWCEDRYGPDTCPAYRGCSYIVFEEIPLEKFGNRIPQISLEVVSAKSTAHPYDQRTTTMSVGSYGFTINGTWMLYWGVGGTPLEWWDLPTRKRIGSVPAGGGYSFLDSNVAISPDGTAIWYGPATTSGLGVGMFQYICPVLGSVASALIDGAPVVGIGPSRIINGVSYCGSPTPGFIGGGEQLAPGIYGAATFQPHTMCGRDFFQGPDGKAWGLFEPAGSSNQFMLRNMDANVETTFTGLVTRSAVGSPKACWVPSTNEFFICADGKFYRIDAATMALVASGACAWGEDDILPKTPGPTSVWSVLTEYSLKDGSLIRTEVLSDWVGGETYAAGIYDPISNAIVSRNGAGSNLTWRYLDRLGSNGVMLRDIVDDVSGWCGLTTIDAIDLDQVVTGYSVTQGSGKDMISPLLDIHDSDVGPHDFTVLFRKRGLTPGGTLLTKDFVRDGDSARYTVTIAQDTDIPRRITLNYADDGKDQQTNTVISQRPLDVMDSVRETQIDMTTYVSTPDEAQSLADRYFRRQWNEREDIKFGLTAQYLGIEPGDVWTASLDGLLRNVRCTKATLSAGAIQFEWKRDEHGFNTLSGNGGAAMDGRDPEVIYIPGPTKGFVLDMPLSKDADAEVKPVLYYGAGPYANSTSWPGAAIYEEDGDDFDPWNAVDSASRAVWGMTTNALGAADPWLWDRGNSVNVMFQSEAPVSVTESAIDSDTTLNMARLGSEWLQFTTATLQGDGSYTITGLKRGRRGTEWAVAGHAAGEEFVLASTLVTEGLGLDEVGSTLAYRAATLARSPGSAPSIPIVFTGASLKPYAPARIKWTTDGTDLFGEIIRRTRIGGAWIGGTTIPLSENSEAYSVDVYNGSTLKRTIAVTGTNTFTYTAAMMTADGNSVGTPPPVHVYQLSDAVGRGFALAA